MAKWDPAKDWEKKQARAEERKELAKHVQKTVYGTTGEQRIGKSLKQAMDEQLEQLAQRQRLEQDRWEQQYLEQQAQLQQERLELKQSQMHRGYYDQGLDISKLTGTQITAGQTTVREGYNYKVEAVKDVLTDEVEYHLTCGAEHKVLVEKKAPTPARGMIDLGILQEAHQCAMASEKVVRLQLEAHGMVVIGMQGDDYVQRVVSWEAIEQARTNILIDAIQMVEKELDIVGKLQAQHGKQRAPA